MAIKINFYIRHNGKLYEPGDIIQDISKSESKRLVKKALAEEIEFAEEVTNKVVTDAEIDNDDLAAETVEETLDLNFNTDELKDGAKEQNIDFKANISKKALIDLIVSNEATDYFLDQLTD